MNGDVTIKGEKWNSTHEIPTPTWMIECMPTRISVNTSHEECRKGLFQIELFGFLREVLI